MPWRRAHSFSRLATEHGMSRKEVSIVVVPHYGGRTIERRFSLWSLKLIAVLLGVLLLGALVFVVLAARVHIANAEFIALKSRNVELEKQLTQVEQLRLELARMKQEDDQIRAMLGFDQAPPKLDLEKLYVAFAGDSSDESLDISLPESAPAILRPSSNSRVPSIPPLNTYTISRGTSKGHPGIDLVAETGTPVIATAEGVVKSVGWDTTYGNSMTIQHDRDFRTFYGHLLRVTRLNGDSVHQGQLIGYVGSTGRSTGPHLHYEVIKGAQPQDPQKYFQ
jgi:murein DD-endopeptidase MepM/ murein hydrolase activator NlpD